MVKVGKKSLTAAKKVVEKICTPQPASLNTVVNEPINRSLDYSPTVISPIATLTPTDNIEKNNPAKKELAKLVSKKDRDVELLETGLTNEVLFKTIVSGLAAETVLVDTNGLEVGRIPNHTIRVKYASLAADILGQKISGNDTKNVNLINIYLPDQLKSARERFAKSRLNIDRSSGSAEEDDVE